jgi:predicted amidohydrolase
MKNHQNFLPTPSSAAWQTWSHRPEISPTFQKVQKDNTAQLSINSDGRFENYGIWHCTADIKSGDTYEFSVDCIPKNIAKDTVSIYAMISCLGSDSKPIKRIYANDRTAQDDGSIRLSKTIDTTIDVTKIKIELALRWTAGSVMFKNAVLKKSEPIPQRKVRVATTLITTFKDTLEGNLQLIQGAIDTAAKDNPDIICLTETPYDINVDLDILQKCETIPGRLSDAIAQKAKQHSCYIIWSMFEKDGSLIHNTGVLMDRGGHITGKYHKVQLPLAEAEFGVTPGCDFPVFDTDFGKIGILICFDHFFPEPARILSYKGAEIIFVPTMGNSPIPSVARAIDNGVFVVIAGNHREKPSRIIDPKGVLLAELENESQCSVTCEIDLSEIFYEHWLSIGDADADVHNICMSEPRVDVYDGVAEGNCLCGEG